MENIMKILVCVKQVPDTNEVRLDPKTGTLIRDGVPSIINPDDKNAIEAAVRIKEETGATVTVLCMGPFQADAALREALAMGCDEAVLLSDRAFAGSDTMATSNILCAGINALGSFDIIFCGRQAIDGDTAQVGPQIAEKLDIPQITYVGDVKVDGDTVTVKRMLEDGYQIIETKTPCLLTAVKELNTPRYARIGGIFSAYNSDIRIMTVNDVTVDLETIGLKGSPTNVKRTFSPEPKGAGVTLEGTDSEKVSALIAGLSAKHII